MKIFLIILFAIIHVSNSFAQTSGTLTVTTTTSDTGGKYKPKNIIAIWIEDNSGNFVKTLLAYAEQRKQHLAGWKASTTAAGSPYNVVDAITGATRTSHAQRSSSWNGKSFLNALAPDGNYVLKMEITDYNGTGRSAAFNFTKGPNSQTLTPANVPSFSNISIVWQPMPTGTFENSNENDIRVYPNPVTSKAVIYGSEVKLIEVFDIKGILQFQSYGQTIDLTTLEPGLYLVRISTQSGIIVKKIMKI
jgi:hypothetical protein